MKVVVVGAGQVGFHISERLALEGHQVTVIERNAEHERKLRDRLNALLVVGNGGSPETLERAGIAETDLFIAVTDLDEVNIIACMLAGEYDVPQRIARVRSLEYERSDGKLNARKLGIDLLINPQAVVADEISKLVAYGDARSVAEFAEGRVLFLGYSLGEDSPLAGVTLRELGEIRGVYGLVVTALVRGEETLIPGGDAALQPGDLVYFACKASDLPAIRYLFGLDTEERAQRVFVLGGGRVGRLVARRLTAEKRFRVAVVDRNEQHCNDMARDLERVRILNADGTDIEELTAEGLDKADVFVAVTQDDKANILCALLAKHAGASRVIALVDHPQFANLAPRLGVDAHRSARLSTAAAILKFVRGKDVESLAMLDAGRAEVVELVLPPESPHLGQEIRTLRMPDGSIVASIVRGDEVLIPGGADHLEAGDHAVLFVLPESVAAVQRFFAAP